MDKCPHCGAETRPGDNFCLNCGNRLVVSTPSTQPAFGDSTLPSPDDWSPPTSLPTQQATSWNDPDLRTMAATSIEPPTVRTPDVPAPAMPAVMNRIEEPAHIILRSDSGEILNDYTLDKAETSIGRAPNSDILLSKDKLTSRRHATIIYENGQYSIRDERSANGTFVNQQQLEQQVAHALYDGDRVGIGEYELLFRGRARPASSMPDIDNMPTMMVNPANLNEMTYRTREDELMTANASDEFGTQSMNGGGESVPVAPMAVEQESTSSIPTGTMPTAPEVPAAEPVPPPMPASVSAPASGDVFPASSVPPSPVSVPVTLADTSGVNFNRLNNLPQPTLPDISPLTAALATLDGQMASLQEQLNATQEAMRNHEADIAQTSSQLRNGVRAVSERMDKTIADVARNREQLAWAELSQLMEDVMNNPRDIEYVTKLARKARELNKVFQIHQNVLNTLAECTSLLRGLVGE